jgi:hypothetical protein
MTRSIAIGAVIVALAFAAPAAADPPSPPNGHNCAGVIVSSVAGPGFGQVVSSFAHQQTVDNLGFANCGQPPRNNP